MPKLRNRSKRDLNPGAKTIKKNTNSTPNKSQTRHARAYEVMSFLSADCDLSTETCSRFLYSLGPRLSRLRLQGPYSWVGHKALWPVITPMIEHTATTSYSWARKALSYITVTVTTLGPNTPRYNAGPSCATSQSHQWLPNTSCYYS